MKKINYLLKEISTMEGNLLGIGISEPKILKKIDENDKIIVCNLLDDPKDNQKVNQKGKVKKIPLNRLRKIFKHKRVNYLIVNEKIVKEKAKNFISDSIYITKDTIYYLTDQKDKIIKKYSRYETNIEEINCLDGYIIKIDTKKAKNNRLKELFYKGIDWIEYMIDFITNLLLN